MLYQPICGWCQLPVTTYIDWIRCKTVFTIVLSASNDSAERRISTGEIPVGLFLIHKVGGGGFPPSPSVSIPRWFMMYFSVCFLCLRGALSNELVMNISGWTAHSRVESTLSLSHASRVAASEPVPENGLPGRQRNTKLLKYLNIRSLWRLPCNYTCSFHIPPNMGVRVPTWTWIDPPCVWVCVVSRYGTHRMNMYAAGAVFVRGSVYLCDCICNACVCVCVCVCVCSQLLFVGHGPATPSSVLPSLQLGSIQIQWKFNALRLEYCCVVRKRSMRAIQRRLLRGHSWLHNEFPSVDL